MEFRWVLQVTLDEIAGVLILPLHYPVDPTPLLLGQPSESRLWHYVTHHFALEIVGVEVDDVV